jgi:hypothetical protein
MLMVASPFRRQRSDTIATILTRELTGPPRRQRRRTRADCCNGVSEDPKAAARHHDARIELEESLTAPFDAPSITGRRKSVRRQRPRSSPLVSRS